MLRAWTPARCRPPLSCWLPAPSPPTSRCQVIEAALQDARMDKSEVDWLVMHQANMRIMASAADRLGVPPGAQLAAACLCRAAAACC